MSDYSLNAIRLKADIKLLSLINIFRKEMKYDSASLQSSKDEVFDFWRFVFIESGTAVINTAGNKFIMNKGEITFLHPNQPHCIEIFENSDLSFISVSFTADSDNMEFFKNKIIAINTFEHENLYYALKCSHRLFEGIQMKDNIPYMRFKSADKIPFGAEQMLKQHLELILLSLEQRDIGETKEHRINSFAKQTRRKNLTHHIQIYLSQHIAENISLEQMSVEVGYSISQMQKSFKIETGESIIDYFINLKIERAKLLIAEGNLTFTEIARQLGYPNPNYFTRLFKQRVGITPTQYSNL